MNMEELDPTHSRGDNPKHSPRSHTIQQLIRVDEAQNGFQQKHPSSNISSRSQQVIHDAEDSDHPPKNLTVIAKVKEKARRWKLNFSKKKHVHDNNISSWGVSLEDEDDEDPEYLGAPMYESELAPESYKEHARQHPRDPIVSENHVLQNSVSPDTTSIESQEKMIDKKNIYQSVLVSSDSKMENDNASNDTDKQDTQEACKDVLETDEGVSMEEFIKIKLEPGDDEKALSEVISDPISPTKNTTAGGVIEIFRGAVNSLMREGPFQSYTATNSSSISNNEPSGEEEQAEGRTLQTN